MYIQDFYKPEIIGRTKYPRTFEDVVNAISAPSGVSVNLDEYKRVITILHRNEPVIVKDQNNYIHNYNGIGKHDYEWIAGIIGANETDGADGRIYMFAITANVKSHRIMQRSYYKNHLSDSDFDKVVFIPLDYAEAKEVKPYNVFGNTFGNTFGTSVLAGSGVPTIPFTFTY